MPDMPLEARRPNRGRAAFAALVTLAILATFAAGTQIATEQPARGRRLHVASFQARHLGMPGIGAEHAPGAPSPTETPAVPETAAPTAPPQSEPAPPPAAAPTPSAAPAPPPAPPTTSRPAPPAPSLGAGDRLLALINQYRAANGLPALAKAADATARAQAHSQDMATGGALQHSPDPTAGIGGGWTAIGENVGVGASVEQVHEALSGSATHRANLLDAGYTQIGVGVVDGGDGRVWVTQLFVAR